MKITAKQVNALYEITADNFDIPVKISKGKAGTLKVKHGAQKDAARWIVKPDGRTLLKSKPQSVKAEPVAQEQPVS
jgi:hypothetical protein